MLRDRVADMPASHDVAAATVARVHRRRAVKLGAFATAVVLVVGGTAAAVAQTSKNDTDRVSTPPPSTSEPLTTAHGIVRCPLTASDAAGQPASASVSSTTDPPTASLSRFGTSPLTDSDYAVLGPTGWSCLARLGGNGVNGSFVVYDPNRWSWPGPAAADAPI